MSSSSENQCFEIRKKKCLKFWNIYLNFVRNQNKDCEKEVAQHHKRGRIAQSVTCLIADPGDASSIRAQSHTFVEIDHEIISTAILLSSSDSRRVVVSYKRKYVHKVLVNCLVKLAS